MAITYYELNKNLEAGKMTSDKPHLVPFEIIEEFALKIGDNKETNIKISEPREIEKGKSERNQKELSTTKNEVNNNTNSEDKQNTQELVKFHSPETGKENLEEKESKETNNKLISNTSASSNSIPTEKSKTTNGRNYSLTHKDEEQKNGESLVENLPKSNQDNISYWIIGGVAIITLLVIVPILKRKSRKIIK